MYSHLAINLVFMLGPFESIKKYISPDAHLAVNTLRHLTLLL